METQSLSLSNKSKIVKMKSIRSFRIYYTCGLLFIVLPFCISQSRHLPTRLMPPPPTPRGVPKQHTPFSVRGREISHLILKPDFKNRIVAQIFAEQPSLSEVSDPRSKLTLPNHKNREAKKLTSESNSQSKRSPTENKLRVSVKEFPLPKLKLSVPKAKTPFAGFTPSPRLVTTQHGNFIFPVVGGIGSLTEKPSKPTNSKKNLPTKKREIIPQTSNFTNPSRLLNQSTLELRGSNLSLKNIFSPEPAVGNIIFPEVDFQDNSWQPIYRGVVFPDEEIVPPPASNTFTAAFASLLSKSPVVSNINLQNANFPPHHHLFVSNRSDIQSTRKPDKPNRFSRNNFDRSNDKHQKVDTRIQQSSSSLTESHQEDEYVIHLNSTDRIKELIKLLNDYLANPVYHQLSTEFENLAQSSTTESFTSPTTTEIPHNFIQQFPSNFQNGFLAILNSSDTEITHLPLQSQITLYENDSIVENNSLNTRNFNNKRSKSIPNPVKIDPLTNDAEDRTNKSYPDLLFSPSLASLLTISKSVINDAQNFDRKDRSDVKDDGTDFISRFFVTKPTSVENSNDFWLRETSLSTNDVKPHLTTKTSSCPKLFGQLLLLCEIPFDYRNTFLTKKWKKRSYTEDGLEFQQVLTVNDRVRVVDNRFSIASNTPHSYDLRISDFKIQDVGSYECEVEGLNGIRDKSQVVVFTCL